MIETAAALPANQANWDERVTSHLMAYGVEDFIADSTQISSVVREDLTLMRPHNQSSRMAAPFSDTQSEAYGAPMGSDAHDRPEPFAD